jgi:type II secretory pathway component GspD/PulD (secretin)
MNIKYRVSNFIFVFILSLLLLMTSLVLAEESEEQPPVTLMLFETDIREALNEISLQTGVNIIPDQTVSGVVTVDLQDVPLEKALTQVLVGGGYTFRKIDDYYLVGLPDPKSRTFSLLAEIEVIELKNMTAGDVIGLLPDFLQGYVMGGRTGNKLTLVAPESDMKRLKELILKLDKPQRMVEIKVLVTEVDKSEIKKLGINQLDYSGLEEGEEVQEGFSYNIKDNLLVKETNFYGYLLTRLNFLEREEKAKITADPRIVVNDGETAKLFIGQNRVVILGESSSGTRTEKIEVGVGLEVTPNIIDEDEIVLSISPEISRYVEEIKPDLIVKRNSVSTNVRLGNGQTLILSGMTGQNDSSYTEKVPFLGNIPLIRWLFLSETKSKSERELLIFVTAIIQ